MRVYLLPYGDILAYCLMPDHFHWLVKVNSICTFFDENNNVVDVTEGVAQSDALGIIRKRTINHSIGILLRSYTNAINKQNGSSGSLFRKETKAECLTEVNGITPSFYNTSSAAFIRTDSSEDQYPQVCFNYIHQNPVRAGIAMNENDWDYSSAKDYSGLRNGTLVNKNVAKKFIVL